MTPGAPFDELLQTARADESIRGLILYGSRAADVRIRGLRLGRVVDRPGRRIRRLRGALRLRSWRPLEIGTDTVDGLRAHSPPERRTRGTGTHSVMAGARRQARRRDRRDRRPQASAARRCRAGNRRCGARRLRQQHLPVAESSPSGEVIGTHPDAAEAASHMLDALFALRGRVRPWSKYPRWELELEPLGAGAAWRADVFLERLERLLQEPWPAGANNSSSATSRSSSAPQVMPR